MRLQVIPAAFALAAAGCGHTLSPAADAVLYTEDKASVAGCQALGRIDVSTSYTVSAGGATGAVERRKRLRNELREKGAEKGANMLLLDPETSSGLGSLTSQSSGAEAYRCPSGGAGGGAAAPSDAGASG